MHDSATIKDFKTLNLTINKIPKGASQSQGGQKLPLKKLCRHIAIIFNYTVYHGIVRVIGDVNGNLSGR